MMNKKELEVLESISRNIDLLVNEVVDLKSRVTTLEQSQSVSIAKTSAKSSKGSTTTKKSSKKTSAQKSSNSELVEFTNKNGVTKMVSAKQAAAWQAYNDRAASRMSLDEIKAVPMPKITKDVKSFVKAHPSCSAKEVKAQFPNMKGLQREQLKALKVELGLR